MAKAIECHYSAIPREATRPGPPLNGGSPVEGRTVHAAPSPVVGTSNVNSHEYGSTERGDISQNDDCAIPESTNPEWQNLDWDFPDIDFVDLLDSQTNQETVQWSRARSPSLARHSPSASDQTTQVQRTMLPGTTIPMSPISTLRSLIRRSSMSAGAHRVAHLTYSMLKSYPMMLQQNDLPPFIHPSLVSSDPGNHDMEPLTNCMSLILMIRGGVRGNRKLFWRNVRQDCERLCAEVSSVCLYRRKVGKD